MLCFQWYLSCLRHPLLLRLRALQASLRHRSRRSPHAAAVSHALQEAEAMEATLDPRGSTLDPRGTASGGGGDAMRPSQHTTLRLRA